METPNGNPTGHESTDTGRTDDVAEAQRNLDELRDAATKAWLAYEVSDKQRDEAERKWLQAQEALANHIKWLGQRFGGGEAQDGPATRLAEKIAQALNIFGWFGPSVPMYCMCRKALEAGWQSSFAGQLEQTCANCGAHHIFLRSSG